MTFIQVLTRRCVIFHRTESRGLGCYPPMGSESYQEQPTSLVGVCLRYTRHTQIGASDTVCGHSHPRQTFGRGLWFQFPVFRRVTWRSDLPVRRLGKSESVCSDLESRSRQVYPRWPTDQWGSTIFFSSRRCTTIQPHTRY